MSPTSSPASTEPALSQLSEDHPAQAYGALPARELLKFVQIASSQTDDREAQQEIIDDSLAGFFRATPQAIGDTGNSKAFRS